MLDAIDRQLVAATQNGLPLVADPYRAIAETAGVDEATVIARLKHLLAQGAIRRLGAIPNHYTIGLTANGMAVWDVADDAVGEVGARVGALEFVTHCYERPRHLPWWPYNLFAMVHGHARDEVLEKVARITDLIGAAARGHDVLFSTRILKKSGLRIAA
ncbi:MAG: AsnC family transcriptional regulator [Bradyrhizobiaceae bacterium]|nr:AsnC family transcriptional regulator [Bradyrhizobiaceae bacterium]